MRDIGWRRGNFAKRIGKRFKGNLQTCIRRRSCATVFCMGPHRFSDERQIVFEALRPVGIADWSNNYLAARIGHCDQVSGEIAAIHRRDVFRLQRAQLVRLIPIVEMATEPLQSFHGCERRLEALQRVERSQPAEITRGDHRYKIQDEICGLRSVSDHRRRSFLKIVRRKHVVIRRDELLEEPPSAARD